MADPPWPERGGGKVKRGADRHYPTMPVADINALWEVLRPLMHEDSCDLYLWATNNYLRDAMEVVETWGFRYITLITWPKPHIGLGQYFRGMTEHCIFARRGKRPYQMSEDGKRIQGTTLLPVWQHPERKHSAKPDHLAAWASRVSPGPRLELFGRQPREGWTVVGNEMSGDDIFVELLKLQGGAQ